METAKKRAVIMGVLGNTLLFILKLIVGLISNSIAIISDALNSLTDIINSIILFISVRVGSKSADKEHPFGHYRSEPIGGLIVAVLTIVLGFEVARIAISRFIAKTSPHFSSLILLILLGTIIIKSLMFLYTQYAWKKTKSPALNALMLDHRNDILISFGAIIGFIGSYFNYAFLDSLMAFLIGIWIIRVGVLIGIQNIKYLVGEAPDQKLIDKISKNALKIKGVRKIQKIRAHYVGVLLHVEILISINRNISAYQSHTIDTNVRNAVEKIAEVDRVFVHMDPVIK